MISVNLLRNGAEFFPAIFEAIDSAKLCVAVEMYIVSDDRTGREFRDHLAGAAGRGVLVMVLVDAVGSWGLSDGFWDPLTAAGGMVRKFRPVSRGMFFFRNHRKLVLVDDQTAFIGGLNIADEYYLGKNGEPPWRDYAFQMNGAGVQRLRRSFDRMWMRADNPFPIGMRWTENILSFGRKQNAGSVRFLESGPEDPMHPVRKAYRQIMRHASRRIDLAMGYFYPHGRILRALRRAVRRGVSVRMIFPRKSDVPIARWAARGLYGRLLRSGAEVWEYTPAMMHAKLAVIDDTVITGSANLDIRSGRINYELVAVVTDQKLAAHARACFEEDLSESEQITIEKWRARPFVQKVKERISAWILGRLDIFFARAELARWIR